MSGGVARTHEMENFDRCMENLIAMQYQECDPDAIVKVKIQCLEENGRLQQDYNHGSRSAMDALASISMANDVAVREMIQQVQADFTSKMTVMRREYDHRFELQATENKRLQNHVASLKADVHQLKRKMGTVIEKVKILQNEFGIVEDWNADESNDLAQGSIMSTSSPFGTNTYSMSRPVTSEK